ncbi:MAG: tetratricopeptide repeat protein [Phycisphaerae bacterium]
MTGEKNVAEQKMQTETNVLDKAQNNRALYKDAMSLYKSGVYDQAADLLAKLIDSTSLQGQVSRFYHAVACRKHAELLMENGNFDLAARYLQRGIKSNPDSKAMISFLAQCYLKQEKYTQAGAQMSRLATLKGENPDLRLKEALSYYAGGHFDRAVSLLESMVRQFPSNFDVNFNLGMILAGQDQVEQSIPYLTKACRLRPENVDAQWKLGLAQGLRGHLIEGVRHLQQAHRLEPENNWLLCHLTLVVKQARHEGLAVTMDVVKIDQISSTGAVAALNNLSELIVAEPDFVTAFLDLPTTDIDDQIFSALLQIVMRALERHPEYADLHHHCSCIYQRLGQSDKAIRESQQALEINPRYVNALIQLARLYSQTDRNQEAITRLQTAILNGANYADVHYLLGNLYHKQGSLEHARRHYRRALKLNNEFQAAEDALVTSVA